ncbi:MAG: hypothetical protein AB2A00_29485 [Myxococcota bacterium]
MSGSRTNPGRKRIRTGSMQPSSVSETTLQPVPTLSETTLQPIPSLSGTMLQPVPAESGFDLLSPWSTQAASTDVISVYASLKVLVVDVVDGDASPVVSAFASLGVFCKTVTSANQAVDVLDAHPFHAVFVVVDDDTSSWPHKLLKLARTRYTTTHFLALIPQGKTELGYTLKDLGAVDVIESPLPSALGLLVRVLTLVPDAVPLRKDLREMMQEAGLAWRRSEAANAERMRSGLAELKTLRAERVELERALVEAKEENIALSDACEGLLEHEERVKKITSQLNEAHQQLKRALLEVQELQKENAALREAAREAQDHEAQLVALNQETLAQAEARTRQLDEREQQQKARAAELEAEAARLRARVDELEKVAQERQERVQELGDTAGALEKERAEAASLREQLAHTSAELDHVRNAQLDIQVKVVDLEGALRQARRALDARKAVDGNAAGSMKALDKVIEFLTGVFATGVKAPQVEASLEELRKLRAQLETASFNSPTTTA